VILFPCSKCGNNFRLLLEEYPVKASGRKVLANYVCELHNQVNQKLNKEIFDCSTVLDYWGGQIKNSKE